jgi:hypothetical protein
MVEIWASIIDKVRMNKSKVHVEPDTNLINFLSNATGSTFTDPSLLFPVDVSEWVEFEAIWETVHTGSQGNELIFAAVSQTSGPKF